MALRTFVLYKSIVGNVPTIYVRPQEEEQLESGLTFGQVSTMTLDVSGAPGAVRTQVIDAINQSTKLQSGNVIIVGTILSA